MVVAAHVLGYGHGLEPSSSPGGSSAHVQSRAAASDLGVGVLFDRLLDAVVIARLTTGRIVLWNPAAEKLFGYTAEEAIGQSLEILMPEPIADVHRLGMERYLRTGHGLIVDAGGPVEMPARTKHGAEIRVELALSELQNARGERFALAVIRDAMHRKQLELTNLELVQTRLRRSEAESTLVERDELLDGVSATLESDPTPAQMQRLRRALADFSRLRHRELTIRTVDGDLVDIVHAACDSARRRAAGRRLFVHTPPTVPASFDPVRLRQVLDQLLDEIILRTEDTAHIEIRADVLSPQLVQLTIRSGTNAGSRPAGVAWQLSRALMERQGGTLSSDISSSGSLEVVMTLPGTPHQVRRRPGRAPQPGRAEPDPQAARLPRSGGTPRSGSISRRHER
jgi:PAS domain S-box-containing protein